MAENQPDQNAAATGPVSQPGTQQPTPPAADPNQSQPTLTFDSLSDEQRSYLKGQGITGEGALTTDALIKVVDHARSSQKTLAERQAELDKLRNPDGTQNQPTSPSNGQAPAAPGAQSSAQPEQGIDEVTAYSLAGTLVNQFPKLSDKFADGSFYKDMANEGYPLVTTEGKPHLDNIRRYAARATKEIEIAEKEAELNKPGEIPEANGSNTPALDASTEMTVAVARNIVLQDPSNPRFAEAQKVLQASRLK